MKAGGGFIDDEAIVVVEKLHPRWRAELAQTEGPGTRWVSPIRLDLHRAVIVRDTAMKDPPPLHT